MTATRWDEEFEDVAQQFYPGSSHPISRHPNRDTAPRTKRSLAVDDLWDEHPRVYKVNGEDVEFFTTGQLGLALGRKPVTIRKWERDGVIPMASFQTPGRDGDTRGRRRLYSRKQVEGIILIAHDEGLFTHRRKPFNEGAFTQRVLSLFTDTETSTT